MQKPKMQDSPREALGKAIRIYRIRAGMNQKELAEKLGISTNYLGMIERGDRNPSQKILEKIASTLEISISDIYIEARFSQRGQEFERIQRLSQMLEGIDISKLEQLIALLKQQLPGDNNHTNEG